MLSQFLRRHAQVFMPACSANTELSMFAVGRYCAERSIAWYCTNSGSSLVALSAAGKEIFFLTGWRAGPLGRLRVGLLLVNSLHKSRIESLAIDRLSRLTIAILCWQWFAEHLNTANVLTYW